MSESTAAENREFRLTPKGAALARTWKAYKAARPDYRIDFGDFTMVFDAGYAAGRADPVDRLREWERQGEGRQWHVGTVLLNDQRWEVYLTIRDVCVATEVADTLAAAIDAALRNTDAPAAGEGK